MTRFVRGILQPCCSVMAIDRQYPALPVIISVSLGTGEHELIAIVSECFLELAFFCWRPESS